MTTQRTRDLVAAAPSVRRLNLALNSRRRLQEEAIKINRGILELQKRLAEIDQEEELLAAIIDGAGQEVEAAVTKTPPAPTPPARPAKKKTAKKKATKKPAKRKKKT